MPKNIVICSDGTGNTAIKGRGTNVFKLFEAVDLHGHRDDNKLTPQVNIYDDGVGTQNFKLLKIMSGALGFGLSRNVRQLYAELVRVYDEGDYIYLFGFSRGAFTVRTLAGMICTCGILKASDITDDGGCLTSRVEDVYKTARKVHHNKLKYTPGDEFHKDVPIKFIGVWDTVDAVGFPVPYVADWLNHIFKFKFSDYKLHKNVNVAYHALSVDDARKTFHPLLWDHDNRITQTWFSGVHTNVGGGYPKQGVSLVTMDWMMRKAEKHGLRLLKHDREQYYQHKNIFDKVYDSRSGAAFFYRYAARNIDTLCEKRGLDKPNIHISVFDRIAQGTDEYAPCNLSSDCNIVALNKDGEDIRFDTVEDYVRDSHQDMRHLLDDKGIGIAAWVRRISHIVLMATTLVFVYLLWVSDVEMETCISGTLSFGCIGDIAGLFIRDISVMTVLLVMTGLFIIEKAAQTYMEYRSMRFWIKINQGLKNVLNS